jgi:hypothetical protein
MASGPEIRCTGNPGFGVRVGFEAPGSEMGATYIQRCPPQP